MTDFPTTLLSLTATFLPSAKLALCCFVGGMVAVAVLTTVSHWVNMWAAEQMRRRNRSGRYWWS